MKAAISQPTYLPWMGYFDLIDQVDRFIFLDTVQFEKRSWQQRNRIKSQGGLSLLTVPASVKGRFAQKILDVEIESPHFVRKHLRSVEASYRRAPFFHKYFPGLAEILQECAPTTRLADLNIALITWMCRALGVTTPLLRASEIPQTGARSELLLSICQALKASSYLSSLGSADYLLQEVHQFSAAGIEVSFQHYEHPVYSQQFPPFCSHASALDLIFNAGENSLEILRSGRRPALRPEELPLGGWEQVAGA